MQRSQEPRYLAVATAWPSLLVARLCRHSCPAPVTAFKCQEQWRDQPQSWSQESWSGTWDKASLRVQRDEAGAAIRRWLSRPRAWEKLTASEMSEVERGEGSRRGFLVEGRPIQEKGNKLGYHSWCPRDWQQAQGDEKRPVSWFLWPSTSAGGAPGILPLSMRLARGAASSGSPGRTHWVQPRLWAAHALLGSPQVAQGDEEQAGWGGTLERRPRGASRASKASAPAQGPRRLWVLYLSLPKSSGEDVPSQCRPPAPLSEAHQPTLRLWNLLGKKGSTC